MKLFKNKNIKILPITKDYLECAINFDEKYKNIIEEIKNIYYNNLDDDEKNIFLDIINKNDYDENDDDQEDIQTINDISEEEVLKEFIKEYISISMIESNEVNKKHKVILFIPTENNNIKEKVIKYIERNNSTELLSYILFGSLEYYNTEDDTE